MPKFHAYCESINFVHKRLASHMQTLASERKGSLLHPAADHRSFWAHQYREFNKEADNLAKRASKGETFLHLHCRSPDARPNGMTLIDP